MFQVHYSLPILTVFFTQEKIPLLYIKNLIQHFGIGLSLNIVSFLLNGWILEVSHITQNTA